MLGEIGTLEWTRRTNGILSGSERARYIAAVTRTQALIGPRMLAYRLGRGGRGVRAIGDDDLRIPDSKVALDAVAAVKETHSRTIVEHNYRSFIYARAFGALGGIAHDEEVLFVAAMFHDAGLMEPGDGRCFTLTGADQAERHLAAAGTPASKCAAAAEAVTLHINPAVPLEHGAEQHLMHDGVLLDAVGARAWELGREGIERVRERHPRLGFTQEARRLLGAHGKAVAGCRAAAAFQAGFGLAVRIGPWQD